MNLFDVIIIGSGPAGLTAGVYTSRANLKTLILAGETWGGQLMQTTLVENFPGFPDGVMGPDLMEKMKAQAEKFGAKIVLENAVSCHAEFISASPANAGVNPRTSREIPKQVRDDTLFIINNKYQAKSVIIATGADTQWLGLPNEQKLIGHGVSSCAPCDGFFFKDKKVAVIGGGDSAMEEALFLTKFASEVTIVHRRDSFRASQIMQDRVKANPKIKFLMNTEVADILGQDKVAGLKFKDGKTIEVDGVFVAIGHKVNDELLKNFPNYPTLPDGLFVAGDVIDTKYKQAVTAAAAGCQAAMDAEKWLSNKNN